MTKNQFIKEILDRTCLPNEYRGKIKRDFLQEFDSKLAQGYTEAEVIESMGDADAIAAEVYESYMNSREIERPFIEYKSDKTIFGMPLVHIVKARRNKSYIRGIGYDRNRYMHLPVAKGFIAIGQRAKGIISIGTISCGLISIGVISVGLISFALVGLGLLSLGNVVVGLLMALGNIAVGSFSIGNIALAYAAFGNSSTGKYAIGNAVNGINKIRITNIQANIPIEQNVIDFINNTPSIVKSFYNSILAFIQKSVLDNHILFSITLCILLALAIFLGIIINNKLDKLNR